MSAKSILQKIKQVIGLSGAGDADAEPTESGGTEVTIEREPDRESPGTEDNGDTDRATASGTTETGATDATAGSADTATEQAPADTATEQAPADTAEDATEGSDHGSEPTNAIKGIGPTYSERLGEAGIETVADLADSDPETVADAAKTGESKAMSWIDRANDRLS
jgi:predicted flap endonuclease-1-like 5' DNA nuclease